MKKILVTGAYGYIGSHTVKALAEHGYHVEGLDISRSSNDIEKYLNKPAFLHDVVRKDHRGDYDAIVHLAGAIDIEESVRIPWKYVKTNVEGTFNSLVKYYQIILSLHQQHQHSTLFHLMHNLNYLQKILLKHMVRTTAFLDSLMLLVTMASLDKLVMLLI